MKRVRVPSSLAIGLALLAVIVLGAWLTPLVYTVDPNRPGLEQVLASPSAEAPCGRDALGRDVLSRVVAGARVSLTVGLVAVLVSVLLGAAVGAVAGSLGGRVDVVLMRATDIVLAFPGLLLATALAAALGPSLVHVVVALAATGWTGHARLVRGELLTLRERDFVQAATALGAQNRRIILRHIMPQLLGPLVVQAVFGISGAIVAEASLSFLGLGAQPPSASWGGMINEARPFLLVAPHLAIVPGLALTTTLLGLLLTGEGLRDRIDVRTGQ